MKEMVLAITSSASSKGQVFLPNQRILTRYLFIWVLFAAPHGASEQKPVLEAQNAELSFFFDLFSVFTIPGPTSKGKCRSTKQSPNTW